MKAIRFGRFGAAQNRRSALQRLPLMLAAAWAPAALAATPKTERPGKRRDRTGEPETHHRTVEIDGLTIFYREAGPADGPVVLLLDGWPSSSRMFRNLIPQLADRYRVIAPDYPGAGNSSAPDRSAFVYSFDHVSEIMDAFVKALHIEKFALYAMDFGGAVGYRLMLKKPYRMTAMVIQNAPAYPEGGEGGFWGPIAAYWKSGSAEDRSKVRQYFSQESIKRQYTLGVRDPSLIDPDNWVIDAALIARLGLDEVSLDMLYDIRNNVPVFAAARQYFRERQPPTLIVSGANDEIFPGDNQKQYLRDLPKAELRLLDTGHFALEDKCSEIAALMHDFLDRTAAIR
jgi:pimeloyl-ACP methyl ester carboxylesterase